MIIGEIAVEKMPFQSSLLNSYMVVNDMEESQIMKTPATHSKQVLSEL